MVDPIGRQVVREIAVGASPTGVAVTSDAGTVLVTDRDDDAVSVIDVRTRTRTGVIPVGTRPFGITIDPQGLRAYTANVGSNDVSQ